MSSTLVNHSSTNFFCLTEFFISSLLTSFVLTKLAILLVPVITVFKPSFDLPTKSSNNFLLSKILPSGNLIPLLITPVPSVTIFPEGSTMYSFSGILDKFKPSSLFFKFLIFFVNSFCLKLNLPVLLYPWSIAFANVSSVNPKILGSFLKNIPLSLSKSKPFSKVAFSYTSFTILSASSLLTVIP